MGVWPTLTCSSDCNKSGGDARPHWGGEAVIAMASCCTASQAVRRLSLTLLHFLRCTRVLSKQQSSCTFSQLMSPADVAAVAEDWLGCARKQLPAALLPSLHLPHARLLTHSLRSTQQGGCLETANRLTHALAGAAAGKDPAETNSTCGRPLRFLSFSFSLTEMTSHRTR